MEDEQDLTIQKKLSFSIDTILDKPKPLYLKIKNQTNSSDGENNKRLHSDGLSLAERLTSNHVSENLRMLPNSDNHESNSDCSGVSCSDVDDDDECGSEDNDPSGNSSYNHHEITHRKKKTRTVFSRTQIYQLETTFDRKRYLSSADRANLAQGLRLTEQQVKVKFLKFLFETKHSLFS